MKHQQVKLEKLYQKGIKIEKVDTQELLKQDLDMEITHLWQ